MAIMGKGGLPVQKTGAVSPTLGLQRVLDFLRIRRAEPPPALITDQHLQEKIKNQIFLQSEAVSEFDAHRVLSDLLAESSKPKKGNGKIAQAGNGHVEGNGKAEGNGHVEGNGAVPAWAKASADGNGHVEGNGAAPVQMVSNGAVASAGQAQQSSSGFSEPPTEREAAAKKISEAVAQLPLYRILREAVRGADVHEQMRRIGALINEHALANPAIHSETAREQAGKFLHEARVLLLLKSELQLNEIISRHEDAPLESLLASVVSILNDNNAVSRINEALIEGNPSSGLAAPIYSRISAIKLSIKNEQGIRARKRADPSSWSDTAIQCEPGHFEPSYGVDKNLRADKG